MTAVLDQVYAQSADILGATAPGGLIPRENVTITAPVRRSVHARTTGDRDRTTIRVSLGLIHLIYRVNRALALRARIVGEDIEPEATGDAVKELARLIDHAAAPMMPLRDAPPLSPQRVAVAELYTHWAEKFLVNHELAHAHGIDQASLKTLPVLADFQNNEYAADLFAAWLVTRQAARQLEAWSEPVHPAAAHRFTKTVYAGAELALHAISMLELYHDAARSPTHPTGTERIQFLRHAYVASGQAAIVEEAREWTALLAANAPAAIATAQVSAGVSTRYLTAYLTSGQLPVPPSGAAINDPIDDLIHLSRAGSMALLLHSLRHPRTPEIALRAREVADRYLPRRDETLHPFWRAADADEGDWT